MVLLKKKNLYFRSNSYLLNYFIKEIDLNQHDDTNSNDREPSRNQQDSNSDSNEIDFSEMPNDLSLNEGQNAKFQCRSTISYSRIEWLKVILVKS